MIADDLGSWAAALRFEDLSEHAIHTVRQRLVDTVGCGLGAFDAEPSRAARRRMLDEIWHVDQASSVTTLTKATVVS